MRLVTFEDLVKDASAFKVVHLEQVFTTEDCSEVIMLNLQHHRAVGHI